MYDKTHQMEPLMPTFDRSGLDELAATLLRRSAALGSRLPPATAGEVTELLRQMNSFYSNLIEGHNTHPLDIERALKHDFASEPARRELQLESVSHVEVQRLIERRLADEAGISLCSADFLCWIHREFYERVPSSFRSVKDMDGREHPFEPGELRERDVQVNRHVPPASATVPAFLDRFKEAYERRYFNPLDRIVAAAAAHQRLAWIHPFQDGNGRVVRLFTDACFKKEKVDGHGLWTISRGLARNRSRYMTMLGDADEPRMGDLDGRGNLSDKALSRFCRFLLETAIDQVEFMGSMLDLETFQLRVRAYVERRASTKELRPQAFHVLWQVAIEGEVGRGEIPRIAGMPERTARLLTNELLKQGLLRSDSPKGLLRIGLPMHAVGYYFPRLFPEGIEQSLLASAPSSSRSA